MAFLQMGVSKNSGTPKTSILIGFSTINHPIRGTHPYFWKHPYLWAVWFHVPWCSRFDSCRLDFWLEMCPSRNRDTHGILRLTILKLWTSWSLDGESTPKSNGDTGWQLPHESLATALVEELASNVQEALTIFLVCSELLDASCKYLLYHLQIPSQVRKILRCAGEFSSPCGGFARLTCLECSSSAAVSNTRNWLLGILANVLVDQDLPW